MEKSTRNMLWILGGLGFVLLVLAGKFTKTGQAIVGKISQAGLDMIAGFEGFSATPYNDPPGSNKYSIGFGHQILPGESFPNPITVEQGKQLLAQDTAKAQAAIQAKITYPLTQPQFDALTSFVYNVGVGAFDSGSVPAKINAGDLQAAADTMKQYDHVQAPGGGWEVSQVLADRRAKEAQAFLTA